MRTAVFIPTFRIGGLDVLEASLARQTVQPDLVIVADDLFKDRWKTWGEVVRRSSMRWVFVNSPKIKGNRRNLAANYNAAAEKTLHWEIDLFISLQDYIWVPPNGIERFIYVAEKCPGDLITGLTSISKDPRPEDVPAISQNFYYSIFREPYTNKPEEIDWLDCRIDGLYEYHETDECLQILPEHWEANWAAVPVDYFRAGVLWDQEYDKGIAYENMDFAKRAIEFSDRRVILDTKNHAISLPHKEYFAGEKEEILEFSNRDRYEERWMK